MSESRQSLAMETLRGLACVLLVAYHVVGSEAMTTGLRLPAEHLLHGINDALSHLRMPLFTFISGYVYCYRPLAGHPLRFLRGKLRRLGLPLLCVATLFAVVQYLTPGTNTFQEPGQLWRIYLYPFAHFWFLQALLVVFALFILLERTGMTRRPAGLLAVLLVLCLIYPHRQQLPELFAVRKAFYLFPYFLLGVLYHRALEAWVAEHRRPVLLTLFLLVLACLAFTPVLGDTRTLSPLSLAFSALLLLLAATANLRVPLLARLGRYSFAIYLLHVFFTAATRLALERLGLNQPLPGFVLGLVAGLLGPVLIHRACAPLPWARLLLFGQSLPRRAAGTRPLTAASGFPPPAD